MHELIEEQEAKAQVKSRPGHVLFDYLWFVIVVALLMLIVGHVGGCDDTRDPAHGSHIPSEVKGGLDVR